jgi:hypothetical protein
MAALGQAVGEDYVRLPHVLTSLRKDEHGVVDEALTKFGLRRTVALTTSRFMVVPFLVAGAPVITTMPARIASRFARAQPQPGTGKAAGAVRLAGLACLLRPRSGAHVAASDHHAPRRRSRVDTRLGMTPRSAQTDLLCALISGP